MMGFNFAVSVTGHRDIHKENFGRVEKQFRNQINKLIGDLGAENFELITSLASGADTLATKIALEEKIQVRIILPAPIKIYRDDFKGKDLITFDQIIKIASTSQKIIIEEIPLPPGYRNKTFSDQKERNIIYVRLMEFLIRRSNLIIAIWDGRFIGEEGGTSEVVRNYLRVKKNQSREMHLFSKKERGEISSNLVIWIPCRRQPQRGLVSKNVEYLFSEDPSDKIWRAKNRPNSLRERTLEFREIAEKINKFKEYSVHSLIPNPDQKIRKDLKVIDYLFGLTNLTALKFQKSSDNSFIFLSLLGGFTGFTYLVYAEITQLKLLLVLYVIIIMLSFLFFRSTKKSGVFKFHLASRNIAELLRLRFFARLSGVDAQEEFRFSELIDEFRFSSFSTSRAIADLVRSSEPLACDMSSKPSEDLEEVREKWLIDQVKYFSMKGKNLSENIRKISFLKAFLLPSSLLQAILLLFFSNELQNISFLGLNLQAISLFIMGLFPLMLAIWELYENKKASRELQWQYFDQNKFFEKGVRQFDQAPSIEEKQKVISKIIRQSVSELYQWMLHRYHREHDPPRGK